MSRKPKRAAETVDIGTVERLATLSRLSLPHREAERLRVELSSIIDYFAALDKVDLSKSAPALEASKEEEGVREDVVRPSNPDAILAGVPRKKGRYVRAPRVF